MNQQKPNSLQIKLVAYEWELFYAWKQFFNAVEQVEVLDDDILRHTADAIVSPANSFGFMDGGLDLKYSQHFGWDLEARVRRVLEQQYFGELPVGQAIVVETGRQDIPFLISAPTMCVPSDVSETVNAYLAFKAILQAVISHNRDNPQKITSVLCPGLGTGEGRMSAYNCAKQMYRAYEVCILKRGEIKGGLAGAVRNHLSLLNKD